MQCLKCGSENSADARFCRACGNKLEGPPTQDLGSSPIETPPRSDSKASRSPSPQRGIKKVVVSAGIATILLVATGGGGYSYYQRYAERQAIAHAIFGSNARFKFRDAIAEPTLVEWPYAIQGIMDERDGVGYALMINKPSTGWEVASRHFGVVDVIMLQAMGLPDATARVLCDRMKVTNTTPVNQKQRKSNPDFFC